MQLYRRLACRPRFRRRFLRHHLPLAGFTVASTLALAAGLRARPPLFPLSLASGYVALALIAVTLLLGPLNLLRGRPNPVSADLRRDVGIWAAVVGLIHVGLGLQNHMSGRILRYFLMPTTGAQSLRPRVDLFGLANHVGLLATLLLALLMALSNDRSLRALGRRRWKAIQRVNYGLFALSLLHSVGYQVLERRSPPWLLAFALIIVSVVCGQLAGSWRHATRASRLPLDRALSFPDDG